MTKALQPPAWVADALCAQVDPEIFYPEKGGSTRDAKAICNGNPKRGTTPCPVRELCLEDALERNELYGILGGLSGQQRRKLRDERAAA